MKRKNKKKDNWGEDIDVWGSTAVLKMSKCISIYAYTHYEFITPWLVKFSDVWSSGGETEREEIFNGTCFNA